MKRTVSPLDGHRVIAVGDRVMLTALPSYAASLPAKARAAFAYAVGRTFAVSKIDERGSMVLELGREADAFLGGSMNDIRVDYDDVVKSTAAPSWLTVDHFPEASVLDYYVALFERAVAGDWRAQLEIGIRYAEGEVFPARFEEGGRWIAIAAESGEADALNAYAHWLCESGEVRRGLALLEQLTREGDAFAPRNLADRCDDPVEARRLRDLAIERGNTAAMLELVDDLAADDMPAALALCRRAAALGDADAAHLLGEAYERGLGVGMDARASLRWHRLAVELARTAPGFGETR